MTVNKIKIEDLKSIDKETIYEGTCLWYDPIKSYGFISTTVENVNIDVWVHGKNIVKDDRETRLHTDQPVSLQIKIIPDRENKELARTSAINVIPGEIPEEKESTNKKTYNGICIRFEPSKDYGFIKAEGFEKLIYVHLDQIKDRKHLKAGQKSNFNLRMQSNGRFKAFNVVPLQFEPDPLSVIIRKGVITTFIKNRAFGFIREDGQEEEHFFHVESVLENGKPQKDQEVRFRLRRIITGENAEKEEAFDVVLGAVRKKEILRGTFKAIKSDEGSGFIERIDADKKAKQYVFDFKDVAVDAKGQVPKLLEGESCTFVAKFDSKKKFQAILIKPDEKELTDKEVLGYEPYLPEHFEVLNRLKTKRTKREENKKTQETTDKELFVEEIVKERVKKKKPKKKKTVQKSLGSASGLPRVNKTAKIKLKKKTKNGKAKNQIEVLKKKEEQREEKREEESTSKSVEGKDSIYGKEKNSILTDSKDSNLTENNNLTEKIFETERKTNLAQEKGICARILCFVQGLLKK